MLARFLIVVGLLCVGGPTLAQTPTELKGHTALVYTLAFSPDGKLLASGSYDNTIKLWDYPAWKEANTLKGHTAPVYCVAFSPDGTLLASASQDKTIRLWNPKDGKFLRELKGHTDTVGSVAFSPDGKLLASAGADKTVRLWNPADGKEVKNLGAHKQSAYCVAFSPDGKWLASCSQDTTLKLWDLPGQKEVAVLAAVPIKEVPKDKKDIKKGAKDKKEDKKDVKEVKKDLPPPPTEVAEADMVVLFTPDSAQLLAAGFAGYLRFWSVAERKVTRKLGPTPDWITGMALSPDRKAVATAGYGGYLKVWDLASGEPLFEHQLSQPKVKRLVTHCVAYTPDGRALVTGHERDNAILVTPLPPAKK
jgi:WD40 repeat protein